MFGKSVQYITWYPGCMKSPAMHREAGKEKMDMELMLSGMRAPIMRKARTRPVTRVTKLRASRFQL